MFEVDLDKKAQKDLKKLYKNPRLLAKFLEIVENIKKDPYSPNFRFERLKGNFSGYCSKRLDDKNRAIYQIFDDIVLF